MRAAVLSMLLGIILLLGVGILWPDILELNEVFAWCFVAWVSFTVAAATCTVLILAKACESFMLESSSGLGNNFRRALPAHMTMLLGGMLVGLFSLGVATFLTVDITQFDLFGKPLSLASRFGWEQSSAQKLVGYFGGLFLCTRLWQQASPDRPTRLMLANVALVLIGGAIVCQVIVFPQPWGLLLAVFISIVVQLSAPFNTRQSRT